MKRFFDKFLLGALWLTTITVVAAFWMNIQYGFNILSGAHWEYLSMTQANGTHIKFDFYTSLIVILIIVVLGLYFILRPMTKHTNAQNKPNVRQNITHEMKPEHTEQNIIQPRPTISPAGRPLGPSGTISGARNVQPQTTNGHFVAAPTTWLQPPTTQQSNHMFDEITEVFTSHKYIIKRCKRISKLLNPVIAVGYDQTIWLGASNTAPDVMQDAIETLVAIFDDTLGETANDITVRGCIIDANVEHSSMGDIISIFKNIDELKSFVQPNTKPDDYDQDLFDAFSTYIDTVAGYIGK